MTFKPKNSVSLINPGYVYSAWMMRGGDVGIMDNASKTMTLVTVLEWRNGGGQFVHTDAQSGLVDTTCARVLSAKQAARVAASAPKKSVRVSTKK